MTTRIEVTTSAGLTTTDAFEAWTNAERLAHWWWPHLPDTTYEIDARDGGGYRIWSEAIGIGAHGDYTVLDHPTRLGFTWVWDGEGGHPPEPVTVTIEPDGDGSTITVVHDCGADPAGVADLRQGWTDVLGRLASLTP